MSDMLLVPKENIHVIESKLHDNLRSLVVPNVGRMSFPSDLIVGECEVSPGEIVCVIDFSKDGRTSVAVKNDGPMQYFSREQFLYLVGANIMYPDEVRKEVLENLL